MEPYKILSTSKYFCTLTLLDYSRPKPFDPGSYKIKKIIRLPLPLEMRDDTAIAFNTGPLHLIGDLANGDIASGLGAEALRQVGTAIATPIQAGAGALSAMGSSAGSALGGSVLNAAGAGLKEAANPERITSAIQQSIGVAPNPNPSVAFEGPILRDMSFTWTFMPTNAQDSAAVRSIINHLKRAAHPRPSLSGSGAILDYPNLVQMNWFPWDSKGVGPYGHSDTSIIKMKRCFMSGVNVNYTSGNAPSFFAGDNNEPTVIQLSVTMKEIEYFTSVDYGDKPGDGVLERIEKGITSLKESIGGIFDATPPEGDPVADNSTNEAAPT